MDEGHSLYLTPESREFRLYYRRSAIANANTPPGGIYQCVISENGSIGYYYAGIYPHTNGMYDNNVV